MEVSAAAANAEDAGLFDRKDCHIFGNYIKNKETKYLLGFCRKVCHKEM